MKTTKMFTILVLVLCLAGIVWADLVAHYEFEDNAGDSSGNGHDGTVYGRPSYVGGVLGKAISLDGVDDYADCETFNPSAGTGHLSVCVWAKWDGLNGQWQGLVAKRDTWAADDMMWQLEAHIDTGVLEFKREGSWWYSGDPVLPVGEWAHVAATFDGTTCRLYVDGVQTGSGSFSLGSDTEARVIIGATQPGGSTPFAGDLDDVRIYNNALSAADIGLLMEPPEPPNDVNGFTYQGRLLDGDSPADGLYDFELKLYDNPSILGNQQGETIGMNDVDVIDGYFTVELNFGSEVFDGNNRWLQIGVRPGEFEDPNEYIALSPLQQITLTPYAIYAASGSQGDSHWQVSGSDIYYNDGNVGIGISTPAAKLDVRGTLNVGVDGGGYDVTLFGSESGSRMFWDESKMALRAGRATGSHWDDMNVGEYSTAMGYSTIANGQKSTAMGSGTTASGSYSTAMGYDTDASGYASTAMGFYTTASGDWSTAMGYDTAARGGCSTAMGYETDANGTSSTAMGVRTDAGGDYSTAMGYETDANGTGSTAMGNFTTANGFASTAMGYVTTANGGSSTAMGAYTAASGIASTAMGGGTAASGTYSTAMGYHTTASGYASTAIGEYVTAGAADNTITIGRGIDELNQLINNVTDSLMVGFGSTTATLFVDGNSVGIGTTTPEFKLTLDNDGGIIAKGTYDSGADLGVNGSGTRLIWYPKKAAFRAGGVLSTQWDNANIGRYSTAIGFNTMASGVHSIATGNSTTASGLHSTAMGYDTTASGGSSTAMGGNTIASGDISTAMGYHATASGLWSTAMGTSTTASGLGSTAIGQYVTAGPADNTFVVGKGESYGSRLVNNTANSLMVGFGSTKPTLFVDGNSVGIGTTSPAYELDVNGDIRATGSVYYGGTEGNADGTAYTKPDYVFEEGYDVMSTEQVEEYLKKENHLPWMTSAKQEQEENGNVIDITRMAFETVETVENLQIQVIELNKLIKEQAALIKAQQKRLTALEKTIQQTQFASAKEVQE